MKRSWPAVLRPHTTDEPVAQADDECGGWAHVPDMFRATATALPPPWCDLFEPLRAGTVDDLVVVGQIGQSLDGRIATENGHSHYINGPEGLAHLHRLRSLVDAVVVGIGTALADDPQLTVRRVAGPHPARVVIDPRGRLPACARLLTDDGIRRLVVTTEGARSECPSSVEQIALPAEDGTIPPSAILAALAARGFRRILIEGGARTVSRFLAANCLDRLHVMVAPLILGSGPAGIALAPVARVEDGMRPPMRAHIIGDEVLWDCDLSGQRMAVGRAKTST
jgi:diaminohydroxyphosphoribosylaminopyrimidine deaminase/5-amino-6-(5-phosphoribosylamino)uracil reductase